MPFQNTILGKLMFPGLANVDQAALHAEAQRKAAAADALAYKPPTATNAAQSEQARAEQMAFVNALKAQIAGTGPSAAQDQLRSATDANIRNAMAMGQSQRGVGYQAAVKGILQNQARTQQESALQSSFLRNQEAMQAQGQLGGMLGGMRGQDQSQQSIGLDMEKLKQNWAVAQLDEAGRKRAADNQLLGAGLNAAGGLASTAIQGGFGGQGSAAPQPPAPVPPVEPITVARGGSIPGSAPVRGDSPRNDTVPAMLSPGEIVLPRSVAQAGNAPDKAAEFVAALKAQKSAAPQDGYGRVLAAQRELDNRLRRIESMYSGGMVR
jgi:hypothetical protein